MKKKYLHINSMQYLRDLLSKKVMDFSIQDSISVSLDRAMKKSSMINLQQKEGNGKSTGLANFIIGRENSYYMKIGPSYAMTNILSEMIFLISGEPVGSYTSNWEMVKRLAEMLSAGSTKHKKLVCIDDCTHLSFRQLSYFQELRDLTWRHTAFVFIAPPGFQARLKKGQDKGIPGVGEFYRRFEGWIPLPGLSQADIKKYCELKKITAAEMPLLGDVTTIAELEIAVAKITEAREYK